jgi:integrase
MKKLTLPKNPHKGLKIYCRSCRIDNCKCKNYDRQVYRVRIHIPGNSASIRTKFLEADNYNDAVVECVDFERELKSNGYERTAVTFSETSTDYSIVDAVIKYREYMSGESKFAHLKKNVTQGHIDESVRYCWKFVENLSLSKNVKRIRPTDIKAEDVSNFYKWAEENYASKTFNKCFVAVRAFFEFLIDIEDFNMKNPFRKFVPKITTPANINTITEDEFERIVAAVDTAYPIQTLGGKGEEKNMYRPYIKDGFYLFLFTGGRREEVVDLKWSDIYTLDSGVKTFIVTNLKVTRIKKNAKEYTKYFPINKDFEDFLNCIGMERKIGTDEFILFPERGKISSQFIMDMLSKSFSFYKEAAGITKDIKLSNLRKTYISWHNKELGADTGLVTNSADRDVLKKYYIDPKIMTTIEVAALNVRVFGKKKID